MDFSTTYNQTREYFLTGNLTDSSPKEKEYQNELLKLSTRALHHLYIIQEYIKDKKFQQNYIDNCMADINHESIVLIINLLNAHPSGIFSNISELKHILLAEIARRSIFFV